jgi:hypothetical protein
MMSYKDSSFQVRASQAAEAKKKALEQLRSRSPLNARVMAERKAASVARETARADRVATKKATEAAAVEASAKAATPPPLTEAERKARRDTRYAVRKRRK